MDTIENIIPHVKLRFNIDHPALEECYAYGYESAHSNVDESANPFHHGSQEHGFWKDGWWDGFYGEKPLFDVEHIIENLAVETDIQNAANDPYFTPKTSDLIKKVLKITAVIAASAVLSYQVMDLVA